MDKQSDSNHSHLDTPEWHEYAERSKAWYLNSKRDKIRRAAKKEIKNRVSEILLPFGFKQTSKGTGWEIGKRFLIRGLYVQASRSGDRCYFNLARRPKYSFTKVSFNTKTSIRLGTFYENKNERVGEVGSLFYYDIEEFPQYVDQAMNVIKEQAVPWLLK